MKEYSLYLFDLDGVLYRGKEVIPGAVETLANLRKKGKTLRFLTNNSSYSREDCAEKLRKFGFDVDAREIYSSAYGTAKFLSGQSAWIIGEPGMKKELLQGGVEIVENRNEKADWVVVGICWTFHYDQLDEAQARIREGSRFLATNLDATYPDEGGRIRPGAGAIVAAVATAAGKKPDVVIGKPETMLIEMILEETGEAREKILLIGDRLDTDVVCAKRVGIDSALVLTGVTSQEPAVEEPKPTYVLRSVAELT
ncbi:MAG TPA: HAD-IIA family hydrolase [Fimbriimonadales bacterium]|nr:HAD-IIA family hydrolase [Fimbriimonadales bacterium]